MIEVTTEEGQEKTKRKDKRYSWLWQLLVIVVIIWILAATCNCDFGAYRSRAYVADTKSNLKNAAAAQQSYIGKNNYYKSCAACTSKDLPGYDKSSPVTLKAETRNTGFVLTATHDSCKGEWTYQSTTGEITGPSPSDVCE